MDEPRVIARDRIWLAGRRAGVIHAKSETVKRQITEAFGPLPRDLDVHIDEQPEDVLDEYLDCLASDTASVSPAKGFALEERMKERLHELDLGDRWYLLAECVDTLFDLTPKQEARFNIRCVRDEFRGVRSMMARFYKTFHDEGRDDGELEGRREILKHQIKTKFGPLPDETAVVVDTVRTKEQLNRYLDRVLTASQLEELGLGG